jgi:hypothetical protein
MHLAHLPTPLGDSVIRVVCLVAPASLFMLLASCGGGSGTGTPLSPPVTYTAKSGVAQKGPLIKGSSVTAQELDAKLSPTGKQYSYQITSDLGTFSPTSTFGSQYIGVSATGYYFDEVQNAVSGGPITLNGYSDLTASSVLNVNLLTTLAYQRIQHLVASSGMTFAAARTQAENEVLTAFNIPAGGSGTFGTLDLAGGTDGDHILAAISSIFVYGNSAGPLSQLIANFQSDIGTNGVITSAATKSALTSAAESLNPTTIAANFTQAYSSVGVTFTATNISDWIDQDGDGLISKFKFFISHATQGSVFAFPAFVTGPYAGTQISLSTGQLFVNGTSVSAPVTIKAGDTVAVSPPVGFTNGLLAVYLLSGTTKIGRASFAGHDTWSPAASMATARNSHTATLLANGKVLVVGGFTGQCNPHGCTSSTVLATAEMYNPMTNAWSPAGSMSTAREYHTATLLPNGKVLVAGGANAQSPTLATAELYDPATNTWSPAATMTNARIQYTATLLPDGRVLVAGGSDGQTYSATSELYDPQTNLWSLSGSLATGRILHTATLLANGKVLVAGGTNSIVVFSSAEIYDPAAGTWSSAGSMVTARENGFTATLLPGGTVLVAGGNNFASEATANAEIYDPVANTWSSTGSMANFRNFHTASLLPTGKTLVAGGVASASSPATQPSASAELYDPVAGTWTAAASLATARDAHVAVSFPDGSVLVIGGNDVNYSLLSSCEEYW